MSITTESHLNNPLSNNTNLIFANDNVDNYQSLVSHTESAELIILDSTRDGVEQVTQALANYSSVDSIHLISHGEVGSVELGSTVLNADNLARYSSSLTSWSDSMSNSGDILLYGCSVGGGITGVEFINNLSQLTDADISASNDLTGNNYQGGDWDLEVSTGPIEANSIYDASWDSYESVLPIGDSSLNFGEFSDATPLVFNGDAAAAGGELRLTQAAGQQKGSAFLESALVISSDTSFSTQFEFQVSGGVGGADGFTFMLQNDSLGAEALGVHGGGLGYHGISQSLAIEFDSYLNNNSDSDLNDNHISVLRDGNSQTSLAVAAAPFNLNGGQQLSAWIDYDGVSDNLEVYLSDTAQKPSVSLLSLNIELDAVVGEQAFLGFSAGTGGRFNEHSILNWELTSDSSFLSEPTQPQTPTQPLPTQPLPTQPLPTQSMIDFDDFSDLTRLSINGSAAGVNGAMRLTEAQQQSGSFFYDEPIRVESDTNFSTEFQFILGGGTGGADGFTFMLQNDRTGDRALGANGGGVGYQGISQSLAIEFDTYQGVGDPNNNHISILSNGDTINSILDVSSTLDLNSGEILNAWIDYNGASNSLEVYLDSSDNKPQTALLSTTVDLSELVGNRARVGFSAGTGGAVNSHELLNWEFNSSDLFAPEGDFGELISWPAVAIHAGLTPDGKVLTYGLDANFGLPGTQVNTKFLIWDPEQGTSQSAFEILDMSHPIDSAFCSGMMLLPDGQMLIAGGAIQGNRDAGNDVVHLYDYRTGNITMLGDEGHLMLMEDGQHIPMPMPMSNPHQMPMADNDLIEARWYPTLTTLPDGRMLIQGGRDALKEYGVITPEIYTPGVGSALLPGATSAQVYSNSEDQWWYPRSWVAPNGQVFGIAGNDMYYLDPTGDGSIEIVGEYNKRTRGEDSTAVMFAPGKILQVGGALHGNSEGGDNEAWIIDINGEQPVVTSAGSGNYHRVWADSTVLPDGTVFVSGGSSVRNQAFEYRPGEYAEVAYAAEIWNPADNSWTVVDSATDLRLYHSTSLLLPDATVLTAGGTTLGYDDEALTGEVYHPAYLYDDSGNLAERPTIASEQKLVDWNQTLNATVGNADRISRVSLVAFGTVTHSFDMGQRFLELDFTQSGNQLNISTPTSANIAPPGYYMVFAFDENGVPSEAHIVQFVAQV